MEEHLGRELDSVEHVDHINNNPSDNRIENLHVWTNKIVLFQKFLKSLSIIFYGRQNL